MVNKCTFQLHQRICIKRLNFFIYSLITHGNNFPLFPLFWGGALLKFLRFSESVHLNRKLHINFNQISFLSLSGAIRDIKELGILYS